MDYNLAPGSLSLDACYQNPSKQSNERAPPRWTGSFIGSYKDLVITLSIVISQAARCSLLYGVRSSVHMYLEEHEFTNRRMNENSFRLNDVLFCFFSMGHENQNVAPWSLSSSHWLSLFNINVVSEPENVSVLCCLCPGGWEFQWQSSKVVLFCITCPYFQVYSIIIFDYWVSAVLSLVRQCATAKGSKQGPPSGIIQGPSRPHLYPPITQPLIQNVLAPNVIGIRLESAGFEMIISPYVLYLRFLYSLLDVCKQFSTKGCHG